MCNRLPVAAGRLVAQYCQHRESARESQKRQLCTQHARYVFGSSVHKFGMHCSVPQSNLVNPEPLCAPHNSLGAPCLKSHSNPRTPNPCAYGTRGLVNMAAHMAASPACRQPCRRHVRPVANKAVVQHRCTTGKHGRRVFGTKCSHTSRFSEKPTKQVTGPFTVHCIHHFTHMAHQARSASMLKCGVRKFQRHETRHAVTTCICRGCALLRPNVPCLTLGSGSCRGCVAQRAQTPLNGDTLSVSWQGTEGSH